MANTRMRSSRCAMLLLLSCAQTAVFTLSMHAQAGAGGAGSQSSLPSTAIPSPTGKATAVQLQGPGIVPKDISELRIEPGDLLSVNVYETPELSNSYRVDLEGNLTMPLCGKVSVRGLTLPEAASRLESALREGQILVHPQVTVDVQQYAGQFVFVTGEVALPGRVPLFAPAPLSDLLAEAGGVTPLAGSHIRIRRGADASGAEEEVAFLRNKGSREIVSVLVRPGDSVIVPRAGVVYVLGAVNRPGGYLMQEDGKLNVAEALALSGGTVLQANTGGLRVIRRNSDGTVLDFPLSYDAISKGTQVPLALEAQDIVYVPMSKTKTILTSATSIIGQAGVAAIYTFR